MNLDDILKTRIGTTKEITAKYRRVIPLEDYATKTYEQAMTVELDTQLTGMERIFATAILQAQLEYNCIAKMYTEGVLTEGEYKNNVLAIETGITALASKAESMGIDIQNLISSATDDGGDALTTALTQNI